MDTTWSCRLVKTGQRSKTMLAKDDLGGSWRGKETINMNIIFFQRGTPAAENCPTNTRRQPPALRPTGNQRDEREKGWKIMRVCTQQFLIGFLFWEAASKHKSEVHRNSLCSEVGHYYCCCCCYFLLNWELSSTRMFNVLTYGFNDYFMAAQEVCETQASQKGHWLWSF